MFQPICLKYPESRQYCLHHHTKVPTGLIFWRLRTCFNNHCNMTHNVHNIPSIYLLLWPVMNNFWKWKDKKWKKGVTFFIDSMTYYYKCKEKWQEIIYHIFSPYEFDNLSYLLNMPFVVLISHMAAKIIILFNKSSFWLILKSSIGLCGLTQSLKQHFTLMHFLLPISKRHQQTRKLTEILKNSS